MINIWIPIKPKPAPRPRVTRYGTYNDPKYTEYKKAIAMIAKTKIKPSNAPITMQIDFFFKYPKSWSKKRVAGTKYHISRPDLDNLQKGVKDALNGIAYKDDSQVWSIIARKQYSQEDGILIKIEEI